MAIGKRMFSSLKQNDRMTRSFRRSVREAIKEKKKKGQPVARYDIENDRSYLEYPDGRKEYV